MFLILSRLETILREPGGPSLDTVIQQLEVMHRNAVMGIKVSTHSRGHVLVMFLLTLTRSLSSSFYSYLEKMLAPGSHFVIKSLGPFLFESLRLCVKLIGINEGFIWTILFIYMLNHKGYVSLLLGLVLSLFSFQDSLAYV